MINFKKGDKVYDRWYPYWGIGIVKSILKTRIKVEFSSSEVLTYDIPHLKFLAKEK